LPAQPQEILRQCFHEDEYFSRKELVLKPLQLSQLAFFLVLTATGIVHAQNNNGPEMAPALPGVELAPQALLGGARHTVQEPIKIEGYFGRFVIESKSGKFSVAGVNMLGVRVSELQAIEALQKIEGNAAFKDALAKSAGGVVKFAGSVVTEPVKTVENIGSGIGTVFGRIGHLAKSGAQYVGDKASDLGSSNAPAKTSAAAAGEQAPSSYTSDPFGYNQARREWAKT
jgi:hypothetical protein